MRSLKICLTLVLAMLISKSAMAEEYLIKISFSEIALILFDGDGQELENFPVALPKVTLKSFPIKGKVAKIEKKPYWFPTEKTRKYYFKKKGIELPKVVEPGHPRNAMGEAKIIIAFETPGVNQTIRIHGTNDKSSIGKRISRGCIRLHNEDVLILITHIEKKPTQVVFVR
jgi:lipoprotein-anchoring transpeptidase ErfK/SrfK